MKKVYSKCFGCHIPFLVFFIIDLPGAGLVALGLQSTIIGWPVAIIWAFKHVARVSERRIKSNELQPPQPQQQEQQQKYKPKLMPPPEKLHPEKRGET